MKIMGFQEAEAVLNRFVPRPLDVAKVYTLDTVQALAAFVGNPQDKLRVVHVAGTSGKTSTCYYVAALLQAAGKSVGLTVSPHVQSINERVQVNGVPLAEPQFCQELAEFITLVEQSGLKPTYFELLMVFAYWEFGRQGVDYAVVEVGLGGLLDGSNIVTRPDKLCLITDIGLDHTAILGTNIADIATQKAGIIQAGNVVHMHQQAPEIMAAVETRVAVQGTHLQLVGHAPLPDETKQLPDFQRRNAALALAAAQFVAERDGFVVAPRAIAQAMTTHIPGRMEVVVSKPKPLILDGAHNPQKLTTFGASLQQLFPGQTVAALVSCTASREHDLAAMAQAIASFAQVVIVTSFAADQDAAHRSVEPEKLAAACRSCGIATVLVKPDLTVAVRRLLTSTQDVLVVTGSLYLLGQVRPHFVEER